MYFSKKLFLLPTLCLLGFTSTHAMDIDPIEKESSSVNRKARLSLVLPIKKPTYSDADVSYEVTLTGTRNGEAKFHLREGAPGAKAEPFYYHAQRNGYYSLKNVPSNHRKHLKHKNIYARHLLSENLDLSQFEGDIRVNVSKILTPELYLQNIGKLDSQGRERTFPLEIRHTNTIGFNANAESIWVVGKVIPNGKLSQAKVIVQKGKGPKSLLSLALEKVEDVIKSRRLRKESVERHVPADVSRLIQAKAYNNKDDKKAASGA